MSPSVFKQKPNRVGLLTNTGKFVYTNYLNFSALWFVTKTATMCIFENHSEFNFHTFPNILREFGYKCDTYSYKKASLKSPKEYILFSAKNCMCGSKWAMEPQKKDFDNLQNYSFGLLFTGETPLKMEVNITDVKRPCPSDWNRKFLYKVCRKSYERCDLLERTKPLTYILITFFKEHFKLNLNLLETPVFHVV